MNWKRVFILLFLFFAREKSSSQILFFPYASGSFGKVSTLGIGISGSAYWGGDFFSAGVYNRRYNYQCTLHLETGLKGWKPFAGISSTQALAISERGFFGKLPMIFSLQTTWIPTPSSKWKESQLSLTPSIGLYFDACSISMGYGIPVWKTENAAILTQGITFKFCVHLADAFWFFD